MFGRQLGRDTFVVETMELNVTLTDPVIYRTPWEADPVTFRTYPEGGI